MIDNNSERPQNPLARKDRSEQQTQGHKGEPLASGFQGKPRPLGVARCGARVWGKGEDQRAGEAAGW